MAAWMVHWKKSCPGCWVGTVTVVVAFGPVMMSPRTSSCGLGGVRIDGQVVRDRLLVGEDDLDGTAGGGLDARCAELDVLGTQLDGVRGIGHGAGGAAGRRRATGGSGAGGEQSGDHEQPNGQRATRAKGHGSQNLTKGAGRAPP